MTADTLEATASASGREWMNVPLMVTFVAVATTSMVADGIVPALPTLQRELHASTDSMGWFYTAPMLAAVVCTPVVARLAGMFDKRHVLRAVLVVLVLGMVFSALADTAPLLVLGQLLSGLSLSLLPLSVGLISDTCRPAAARTANAIVAALGAITPCIGLMLCGPIVDHLSFRWLFWGPGILLGLCLAASFFSSGPTLLQPRPARARLDVLGALLLGGALGCGLLAISRLSESTAASASQWTLGSVAVACAALWVVHERRTKVPLVDLHLLRDPVAQASSACMFAAGFLIIGVSLCVPLIGELPRARGGLGATVTDTSQCFLSLAVVGTMVTPLVGPLSRRLGSAALLSAALVVLACVTASLAVFPLTSGRLLGAMGVIGAAFSVVLVESMNAIVAAFRGGDATGASGLAWVLKSIGATLGGQITAAIIAVDAARAAAGPSLVAIDTALFVSAGMGLLGALAALRLPRRASALVEGQR